MSGKYFGDGCTPRRRRRRRPAVGRRDPARVPGGGGRFCTNAGIAGRDDHRRRRGRRRRGRRRSRHRPPTSPAYDPRTRWAKLPATAGRGHTRRDGRRRRQRRPRAGPGRGRHRDRRRYRRGDRFRRSDPGQRRPTLGPFGRRVVHGQLPEDEAEPVVGGRLQPDLGAACGRRAGADRVRAADVGRGDPDVTLDHRRRADAQPLRRLDLRPDAIPSERKPA